ncbi:FIGNL1-interacting regulator of recombination and mitosis [Entelurus aequoreus]|uniref:FIGNL1-interacting regulator of recombination and mitosis n=1 Tax=Entelurus aequoreus TaxID=161455 RepID=UPI002B1DA8FA|nr:FIGNL1-interacting regulator of recombination and mitosis [Entelurus aequoreus]
MSQTNTSLLEEVVQWSQETCRLQLKSVLPKLTSLHNKSDGWDDHIRVLKIIIDLFLPHIALTDVENECFSKILPKAVTIFDSMRKDILIQVGGLSSQNTELCSLLRNILKSMMQIIDALSTCVRHVGTYEVLDLVAIRTLPTCILKVLRDTFQHCKESEAVYCGRLSLVADLLQGLFKEAYALQKGLLELLDKISLDSAASEEEVNDIVTVIHSLLDISSVISNLDMALHANTWKFLIKQSLKYQTLVEEHLHHGDISTSLCNNLLTSFHNAVDLAEQINRASLQEATQSAEHKLFQKTAKMCRFFANTLVHYIKEFKTFLTKSCRHFHQLYLQIVSKFPPSLCAPTLPPTLYEELNVAALVPMDALLVQLLPLRPFAEVVLQEDLHIPKEHELPQCLLLMNVLSQLPSQPEEEVLQLWHTGSQFSEETPRLPLYQAVFTSFRCCYVERKVPVSLPGVMMKGQAQGQVSLHHHVCVQLCASVAVLPTRYFPVLERCLVEAILQADNHTALLATDVWCFTARYGTAELCLHHVLLIAHLVKTCPAECYQSSHLGLLLRRMLFLMTPTHQMELLERFPTSKSENLPVWRHVLFRALSNDARRRVEVDVIALTQKALTDWQSGGYKLGQVDKVNAVLQCLLVVVRGKSPSEASMSKIVTQLWARMSPHQVQTHDVLQCTLQLLLSMTAVLVKSIEPQVILQALVCVEAVVSQKCADQLLLTVLEFLSSLGKVFIPPNSQSEILPRLSSLFGSLLSESSWLLHQHTLEAFAQFAEITNHEEVISQSLCVEETKSKVVNYLSKTVNAHEGAELRLEQIKAEKMVLEQHNKHLEARRDVSTQSVDDSEPQPKRARQESHADEEYSRYIQTAQSALKAVHALADTEAMLPPTWLPSRLQELQLLISEITSTISQN